MTRIFKAQRGFTLIELVMVITILAVLGVLAIPQYVDLRQEAREAAEAGVAGAVQAGIATFFVDPNRGNRASYPADLDSVIAGTTGVDCSNSNRCFTKVLAQGGITSGWKKLTATEYRSPVNATNKWAYDAAVGSFVKTVA